RSLHAHVDSDLVGRVERGFLDGALRLVRADNRRQSPKDDEDDDRWKMVDLHESSRCQSLDVRVRRRQSLESIQAPAARPPTALAHAERDVIVPYRRRPQPDLLKTQS